MVVDKHVVSRGNESQTACSQRSVLLTYNVHDDDIQLSDDYDDDDDDNRSLYDE